jgi:hypothetical protein
MVFFPPLIELGWTRVLVATCLNWNNVDDPDGIKERLLNVDAL